MLRPLRTQWSRCWSCSWSLLGVFGVGPRHYRMPVTHGLDANKGLGRERWLATRARFPRMEINGIAHIQLTVTHFEAARAFYGQLLPFLGLTPVMDFEGFFYCV